MQPLRHPARINAALAAICLALLTACAGPPQANGDFYTVRSGDTLYSLGRAFGQDYRDLAAWNKISDKDDIQVGQVLRIRPPPPVARTATASSTASASGAASGSSSTAPVRKATPARKPTVTAKARKEAEAKADAEAVPEAAAPGEAARMDWMWPAQGHMTATTDRNQKGIDIAGTAGQPVWASASGKVTYAGRGIRGYGNMIIVKHSRTLLSVYAHNKSIMVKEGQTVNRGQQIAEMGDTDSRTVKLYFEIRSNSKPLNPVPLLPKQQ